MTGVILTDVEREQLRDAMCTLGEWERAVHQHTHEARTASAVPAVERILAARLAPTVALDVETVRTMLADHDGTWSCIRCVSGEVECGCGEYYADWDDHEEHQARAVVAADPRRTVAAVQAETLIEAADEMGETDMPAYVAEWLCERADRIGGDQ